MLPAGRYYIGDLCYLPQFQSQGQDKSGYQRWDDLLDRTDHLQSDDGYFKVDGVKFFSSHTLHGDGSYPDQRLNMYCVDAGIIGCYPVPDDVEEVRGGHIMVFEEGFTCQGISEKDRKDWGNPRNKGMIRIGHIEILTGNFEDECDSCGELESECVCEYCYECDEHENWCQCEEDEDY